RASTTGPTGSADPAHRGAPMARRPLLAAVAALSVVTGSLAVGPAALAAPGAAAPGAATPDGPRAGDPGRVAPAARGALSTDLAGATGTVTAFVQLDTPSGADVTDDGGTPADVRAAAQDTEAVAEQVVPGRLGARTARVAAPQ